MWMTEYIREIKKRLASKYKFQPVRWEGKEPIFGDIPDGEYPMIINGRRDVVKIVGGKIDCCNFDS